MAWWVGRSCGTELAQCSGRLRGSSRHRGRSFSDSELAPFGARLRLPQRCAVHCFFRGRPGPGPKLFGRRVGAIRREVAPPTRGAPCTAFFVGGPTPGRSFFGLRVGAIRREVAPPTRGAPCIAFFVGGPTPGRSFFELRIGVVRREVAPSHKGRRALRFLWEARPRGEAFRTPGWRRSPRVAPPTEPGH